MTFHKIFTGICTQFALVIRMHRGHGSVQNEYSSLVIQICVSFAAYHSFLYSRHSRGRLAYIVVGNQNKVTAAALIVRSFAKTRYRFWQLKDNRCMEAKMSSLTFLDSASGDCTKSRFGASPFSYPNSPTVSICGRSPEPLPNHKSRI